MKLGTCLAWGAFSSLAVACNNGGGSQSTAGEAASVSATASASSSAQAQAPKPIHRPHRGGGMFGMLLRATHDLTLTDAQTQTLASLDDQLHADDATRGAELKALDVDIAAGIRAGRLDTTKINGDYAAIDTAMQARFAKESTAVNGLYAALDAGQRKQLIDGIRAKQAEREQRMKNAPDAGTPDFVKIRVARMTNDFTLDDAQQKQVTAMLAKNDGPAVQQARKDAGKQRVDAFLTAFSADGFDASKVTPPGKTLHEGMERDVTIVTQLLPILKPEQREKLAVQRERMAQARARMGSGDSPWGDDSIMDEGMPQMQHRGPPGAFGAPGAPPPPPPQ